MKEVNATTCGQESELIAFLYGELNEAETQIFQRHLRECGGCNAELAAFQGVRESVVAWRNESLDGFVSPAGINVSPVTAHEKPSALAALREFFNLSPLWMKGAVAFASVLFVFFAGLAIMRLRETPAPVSTASISKTYSEEQLKAIVAQRVEEEGARIKKSTEQSSVSPGIVQDASRRSPIQRVTKQTNEVARNVPGQKSRRPLSKTEREQLAADLRLVLPRSDSDIDLLGDRINQ